MIRHLVASCARQLAAQPLSAAATRGMATQAAAAGILEAGQKIGVVGLGRLGSRMLQHLLRSGHDVVVHDANKLALMRAKDLAAAIAGGGSASGGAPTAPTAAAAAPGRLEIRDSPADIAADPATPLVLTVLSNASACKDVYLGTQGLLKVPGGPRASLFVDCTTVDAATTRQLAAAAGMLTLPGDAAYLPGYGLRDGRPRLLDAPVSGGIVAADAADLTFMVGGNPAACQAVTPLLQLLGRRVLYCGKHGAGTMARLCNTLVVAASMAAVSEALALGRRLDIDPKVLTEVLNAGSARCWASATYNPAPGALPDASASLPSNNGYRPGLPAATVSEHLQMLLDAAKAVQSPTPIARHVAALYERLDAEGLGDRDFSAIFRYVYGSGGQDAAPVASDG